MFRQGLTQSFSARVNHFLWLSLSLRRWWGIAVEASINNAEEFFQCVFSPREECAIKLPSYFVILFSLKQWEDWEGNSSVLTQDGSWSDLGLTFFILAQPLFIFWIITLSHFCLSNLHPDQFKLNMKPGVRVICLTLMMYARRSRHMHVHILQMICCFVFFFSYLTL